MDVGGDEEHRDAAELRRMRARRAGRSATCGAWLVAVGLAACAPPAVVDAGVGAHDAGAVLDAGAVVDIDAELEPLRAARGMPALAALTMIGGQVVGEGAVGLRALDDDAQVTTADRWHIGSCTKAMTATLAALLIEDGVLDWTSTAAASFPDLTVDTGFASTTLEELLGNRGGAPAEIPADLWDALWDLQVAPEVHRARFARDLLARPSNGARGTFEYSNAGFMIAGAMMEAATGESWEALVQERLFDALGMTSCGFGAPGNASAVDEPRGHEGTTTLTPVPPGPYADNPPALGPAGTVHCSLRDWARFLNLHVAGARGDATPLLSPSSFTRLQTPVVEDYALGWSVVTRPWAGGTTLTHGGSNTLWLVSTWLAPQKDALIIAATNAANDDAAAAVDEAFGPMIDRFLTP